jgi:hypothetical protein
MPDHYDDGGISGGTLERSALQRLLADIELGKFDVVVVDKIDRLSRGVGVRSSRVLEFNVSTRTSLSRNDRHRPFERARLRVHRRRDGHRCQRKWTDLVEDARWSNLCRLGGKPGQRIGCRRRDW